jgi:hypothetical protein
MLYCLETENLMKWNHEYSCDLSLLYSHLNIQTLSLICVQTITRCSAGHELWAAWQWQANVIEMELDTRQ